MFKNLNEKIKLLEKKWHDDLIFLINKRGHHGQGVLIDSIDVKVTFTTTEIIIDLKANDYIKYLDEGELIKEFKKEKMEELKKLVQKEIKKDLLNKKKLKK